MPSTVSTRKLLKNGSHPFSKKIYNIDNINYKERGCLVGIKGAEKTARGDVELSTCKLIGEYHHLVPRAHVGRAVI